MENTPLFKSDFRSNVENYRGCSADCSCVTLLKLWNLNTDYQNAIDRIKHSILLFKLIKIGVRIRWYIDLVLSEWTNAVREISGLVFLYAKKIFLHFSLSIRVIYRSWCILLERIVIVDLGTVTANFWNSLNRSHSLNLESLQIEPAIAHQN